MENNNEKQRYYSALIEHVDLYSESQELLLIVDNIVDLAASKAFNAAMSGSHGDNGASDMIRSLDCFLQGVAYSRNGNAGQYNQIISDAKMKADPEYKKYLELKERFEFNQ